MADLLDDDPFEEESVDNSAPSAAPAASHAAPASGPPPLPHAPTGGRTVHDRKIGGLNVSLAGAGGHFAPPGPTMPDGATSVASSARTAIDPIDETPPRRHYTLQELRGSAIDRDGMPKPESPLNKYLQEYMNIGVDPMTIEISDEDEYEVVYAEKIGHCLQVRTLFGKEYLFIPIPRGVVTLVSSSNSGATSAHDAPAPHDLFGEAHSSHSSDSGEPAEPPHSSRASSHPSHPPDSPHPGPSHSRDHAHSSHSAGHGSSAEPSRDASTGFDLPVERESFWKHLKGSRGLQIAVAGAVSAVLIGGPLAWRFFGKPSDSQGASVASATAPAASEKPTTEPTAKPTATVEVPVEKDGKLQTTCNFTYTPDVGYTVACYGLDQANAPTGKNNWKKHTGSDGKTYYLVDVREKQKKKPFVCPNVSMLVEQNSTASATCERKKK